DFLEARANALAIRLELRGPRRAGRACVFVHGLCCTEREWFRDGESYGTRLEKDLGWTPLYVRYNTGLHIADNGRALARLLDGLDAEEIVLIGHSMGGLVARSAAAIGVRKPTQVICIGSPHLGAPLEKGVHALARILRAVEAAGAQVPGRVLDG